MGGLGFEHAWVGWAGWFFSCGFGGGLHGCLQGLGLDGAVLGWHAIPRDEMDLYHDLGIYLDFQFHSCSLFDISGSISLCCVISVSPCGLGVAAQRCRGNNFNDRPSRPHHIASTAKKEINVCLVLCNNIQSLN